MKHLVDLHCHLTKQEELQAWREFFAQLPEAYDYKVLLAAGNFDQAAWLFPAIQQDPVLRQHLIPMAGLHPWQAGLGRAEVDRLRPYLAQSPIIGEIGLDKPWCDVPLAQQVDVLKYQLQLAQDLGKPILLHSKGYERELLDLIRDYPYPIIVHWYSCEDPDLLRAYIDRGCHFTLSTDQGRDPGTRLLWQLAPLDHVHLETDGYEAVLWAQDQFGSERGQTPFPSAPSHNSLNSSDSAPAPISSADSIPAPAAQTDQLADQADSIPAPAAQTDQLADQADSIPAAAAKTDQLVEQADQSIPAALFQALQNSIKTYAALHDLSPQQAEDLFYRNSMGLLVDK